MSTCENTISPIESALDRSKYEIAHPSPFCAAIHVAAESLSRTVDHVSNVEYVRWLDRAAELHCDSLGFTRKSMFDDGRMWFVARHEIDYLGEAHHGDDLILATWVRDVHRVKSWRDSLIVRPADDRIICRAATLWVYVNLATRKPARIPESIIAQLDPVTRHDRTPHGHSRREPSCASQ